MLPDDLIEEGVKKYCCPKCQQEVIDDFQLMAEHLEQCGVNCKTCVDMKTSCIDRNGRCYTCGGRSKWRERK